MIFKSIHPIPFTSVIYPSIAYWIRQFLLRIWPIHLAFLCWILFRSVLLSPICTITCSLVTLSEYFIFFIRGNHPARRFLNSILLSAWRAVRSYRPNLKERDPIWGDDRSHNLQSLAHFSQLFIPCSLPILSFLLLIDLEVRRRLVAKPLVSYLVQRMCTS